MAEMLSDRSESENDSLPTVVWMTGADFSGLRAKVFWAASFLAVSAGLSTMVPVLGLGMRPFGPRILASLTSLGMSAGVARRTSKSALPDSIWDSSESVKTTILLEMPVEWGRVTEIRLDGDSLRLMWSSTEGSNLVRET